MQSLVFSGILPPDPRFRGFFSWQLADALNKLEWFAAIHASLSDASRAVGLSHRNTIAARQRLFMWEKAVMSKSNRWARATGFVVVLTSFAWVTACANAEEAGSRAKPRREPTGAKRRLNRARP